jgi:uncharacterized protein (DUF427 family)
MSILLRRSLMSGLGETRHEPSAKRIRALLGEAAIVDTTSAVLLWEPRRVVPSWAVPEQDLRAELVPASVRPPAFEDGLMLPSVSARPVLDPSVPFIVHTADGEPLDVVAAGQTLPGAAFRVLDPDLTGYLELDFGAFTSWMEEDEVNVSHPKDPFHRVDVLPSSRHVRLELDGELLAESHRPVLIFETSLPVRYYLPREDVRAELIPSDTRTFCAYKGQASYWSPRIGDATVPDLAWSYPHPLHEAEGVRDLIAFFDEKVDVVLDGVRRERPVTPWSSRRP